MYGYRMYKEAKYYFSILNVVVEVLSFLYISYIYPIFYLIHTASYLS